MKAIDKRLDDLWRVLVKLRAGNKCEIKNCQKTEPLNSHHVYSREKKSVRWCCKTGYCLCVGPHIWTKFLSHKTPNDLAEVRKKDRGQKWFDLLQAKAQTTSKLHPCEKKILAGELQKEIDTYK